MTRMHESMSTPGGQRCAYEVEYLASAQGVPTRGTITWMSEEGLRVNGGGTAPVESGQVLQFRFWVDGALRRKTGRVVYVEGGGFTVSFDLTGYISEEPAATDPRQPEAKPKSKAAPAEIKAPAVAAGPADRSAQSAQAARSARPRVDGRGISERWIGRRVATHF